MKRREYIDPAAGDLDCGFNLSEDEWARGFLRLPSAKEAGRARFVESIPQLWSNEPVLPPIPIFLVERGDGTRVCLLNSFATSQTVGSSTSSPYPLELLVNEALVGSDDVEEKYGSAALSSVSLLEFFGPRAVSPEDVARDGVATETRATIRYGRNETVTLEERASMSIAPSSASLTWHAEIHLRGTPQTLPEWSSSLHDVLNLFSFLTDRALLPDRVLTQHGLRTVDYYASWSERSAPDRAPPLFTLPRIGEELDQVVDAWRTLTATAPDFVAHVDSFQSFRGHLTLSDQLLTLIRALEQYHRHAERFQSVVRPKDTHVEILEALEDQMTPELREEHGDWILRSLRESNRKPLAGQLTDILADLGQEVRERCFIANADEFATTAKHARNYHTHPSAKKAGKVPEGRDLLILVNRLWFVVRACVLLELGVDRAEIAGALKRSGSKSYLLK